jgi:MoaA/NifB/PqqE/SkfB family radical SAM enzyme
MKTLLSIKTIGKVVNARFFHIKTPLIVGWAVTHACNRACSYCARFKRDEREMTKDEALRLVDEMAAGGVRRMTLTGGEPLMRKDLGEIIHRAVDRGIAVKVNSNGGLVANRLADLAPIAALTLSVDGPAPVHDALRGPGAFDEAIEAAEAARQARIPLSFAAVINARNITSLNFILDLAGKHQARALFQPPTLHRLGSHEANPEVPDVAAYRNVIQRLIHMKQQGDRRIANTIPGLRHLAHWPDPIPIACAGGWISCRIEPGGDVFHCSRCRKIPSPANALKIGFRRAFESLGPMACPDCWCAGRVELNLAWSGRPDVILQQALTMLKGK